MIRLYDFELSGNCYKVRLMLSILGLPFETVPVDFYPGREHRSDWFLRLNPLGQLPYGLKPSDFPVVNRTLKGNRLVLFTPQPSLPGAPLSSATARPNAPSTTSIGPSSSTAGWSSLSPIAAPPTA